MKAKQHEIPKKIKFIFEILLIITNIFLIVWILVFSFSITKEETPNTFQNEINSLNNDELQDEKLRQEILNIQLENRDLLSPWQRVSSFATIVTVAVALVGTFVTIWKQILEREKDRLQRETESKRILDERFSSIIKDLGSVNKSLKVSAIVSMMTFLRDDYPEYHEQAYLILLSNLKIKQDKDCNRLLVQAFEKAVQIYLNKIDEPGEDNFLDLTNTCLYHIKLEGLNLAYADLAFADLRHANFKNSNLSQFKGFGAKFMNAKFTGANMKEARLKNAKLQNTHFHDVKLHSSNLKNTNLEKAQFYRAELQSVHFDNANLQGARFEEANLKDSYFFGATISNDTLESIKKAFYWQNAHFDDEVLEKLNKI